MSSSLHLVFALLSVLHISGVLSDDPPLSTDNIYVGKEKVIPYEAKKLCDAKYMKLLSIQSAEKNEQVTKVLQELGITEGILWTSGKRLSGKNWAWYKNQKVAYFSWGPGEPDVTGGRKCIAVSFSNKGSIWDERLCEEKHGYICEQFSIYDFMKQ